MRTLIFGCALLAVHALSSPVRKRDVVTKEVIVMDEVIVTVTVMPGSGPESATPAAASIQKIAFPFNNSPSDNTNDNNKNWNWDTRSWSWAHSNPTSSSTLMLSSTLTVASTLTPPLSPPSTTSPPSSPSITAAPSSSSTSHTSSAAPSSSSPPSSACDGSPKSGDVPVLCTVNKWRKAYGLSDLQWDSNLQANAQKTGTDDGGVNEKHELNPGSMAQVITPGLQKALPGKDMGGDSPFELAYVGWLCEVASDPQLANGNQCGIVKNIENMMYSDSGHHDILNSPKYSKIGCAFAANPAAANDSPYQGLWVCDLS